MPLREQLNKLLEVAGISEEDRRIWLLAIRNISLDRAEAFVHIFGQLGRSDVAFLNNNFKEKIDTAKAKDFSRLEKLFREEKLYLSRD
jgi:hypothetical protein